MSKNNEKKHTLLKVVGAGAVAAGAAYSGMSYYVFRNVFDLQNSTLYRSKPELIPEDDFDEKKEWFKHSQRNDDFISSYDGLKLHGLRITNHDDHKWMIIVHGAGQYCADQLDLMYEASHRGYNILAVDCRGCGMSEGRYASLGWNEHYDLISWINHLVALDHEASIVLYGQDTGAAAVMNAIGDYLPFNVKCAIEDGGFSEMKEYLTYLIQKFWKIDGKVLIPGIDFLVKQRLHFSINDISMKHQLSESSVPTLFIHGSEDEIIPTSMIFDNYHAHHGEKEIYIAEGTGFQTTNKARDYYSQLFGFAEKFM